MVSVEKYLRGIGFTIEQKIYSDEKMRFKLNPRPSRSLAIALEDNFPGTYWDAPTDSWIDQHIPKE